MNFHLHEHLIFHLIFTELSRPTDLDFHVLRRRDVRDELERLVVDRLDGLERRLGPRGLRADVKQHVGIATGRCECWPMFILTPN